MSTLNDPQKSQDGFTNLWTYMGELDERKKKEPGDDVITRLIEGTHRDKRN